MRAWLASRGLAAFTGAVLAGAAVASGGVHYEGTSRDGLHVKVYLHGGAVLDRVGTSQSIGATAHVTRRGRALAAVHDCLYRYDESDRRQGQIRCATRAASPLSGAAWARSPAAAGADDPEAPMACVSRCGRAIPARLLLDAHPDNH